MNKTEQKMKYKANLSLLLLLIAFLMPGCITKRNTSVNNVVLQNVSTLKSPPVFIPLSAGTVKPEGWIRDWAENAATGITGHLDEYVPTYTNAWNGFGFKAMGANSDGTGWPLEQSSYWLDGAIRLGYILNDTSIINKVKKRLDRVVNGVLNGGESFIYWKKNSEIYKDTSAITTHISKENVNFNNWAHSHMGRTLVAYYQASRDPKILQALVKVYRHFPVGELWYDDDGIATGATNIDPMFDTYLLSGDKTIRDSIVAFSNRVTYQSVAAKWSKGLLVNGHGVNYNERIRVPALLYAFTGNKTDLEATVKAIRWGDEKHLLPVGVTSSEEDLAGIGAFRSIETCNISAAEWTNLWMLRLTGDKSYADRIEKLFFNATPAPVSRDFKTMSYYQQVNRYSTTLPKGRGEDFKFTDHGMDVLCCVGNLNRIIPNYIMNMWMTTKDGGLAATLYGPNQVTSKVVGNVAVTIRELTAYPFEENINLTVNAEKEVVFPLYLRIPEWCQQPEIRINGTLIGVTSTGNNFIKLSRLWKKNDKVSLYFPMQVKIIKGTEIPYPKVNFKEWTFRNGELAKDSTVNNPFVTLYYGPLLFSFPIPDVDANQELPDVKYNYAIDLSLGSLGNQIEIIRKALPVKWNWSLDAPLQLRVKVKEFNWQPSQNQPLPKKPVTGTISTQINLVPYGCTKFRVTMFPVTISSWNSL